MPVSTPALVALAALAVLATVLVVIAAVHLGRSARLVATGPALHGGPPVTGTRWFHIVLAIVVLAALVALASLANSIGSGLGVE